MKQRVIQCVYAALLLLNGGISRADEAVVAEDKRKAVDLGTYARLLSEHLGFGVSFEGQRTTGEPLAGAALLSERTYLVDAGAANGNATNAIRLLEAAHPDLTGSVDPDTGMLNLYPRTQALCDWAIDRPVDRVASLWQIFKEDDVLGLEANGIVAFTTVKSDLEWLHRPVALRLDANTPVRRALNNLFVQMPIGFSWLCERSDADGKGRMNVYRFLPAVNASVEEVDALYLNWLKE